MCQFWAYLTQLQINHYAPLTASNSNRKLKEGFLLIELLNLKYMLQKYSYVPF